MTLTDFLTSFNIIFGEVLDLLGHLTGWLMSQAAFITLICIVLAAAVINLFVSLFVSIGRLQ